MKKKNYRLTCLISQQTKDIKKVYENILNLVKEQGEITYKQEPIQKSLAYPIKKEKGAFLIDIFFTSSPEEIEGIEKKLQANSKVLRRLVVSVTPKELKALTTEEEPEEERDKETTEETTADQNTTTEKKKKEHGKKIDEKLNQILK